jgi:hypothetical protein
LLCFSSLLLSCNMHPVRCILSVASFWSYAHYGFILMQWALLRSLPWDGVPATLGTSCIPHASCIQSKHYFSCMHYIVSSCMVYIPAFPKRNSCGILYYAMGVEY